MSDPANLVTLKSAGLSAEIDPLGAELHALRDADGRDLQWDGDPAVWTGRAPILFPIVGALAGGHYGLGEREYALPKHGFARRSLFQVVEAGESRAVFRLGDTAETRAVYPFAFTLEIAFALSGASLEVAATLRNPGAEPLPASFGFHPALRWPLPYGEPRADHRLRFPQAEPSPIRRIDGDGLLRPQPLPTPVTGRDLVLRDALFEDDAVIFDQLASREVLYGAPEGPQLRVAFPDAAYLGVWTKPGAGYICIEPWWGIADPEGFSGDFRDKPGVFEVAPAGSRTMRMTITLEG